MRAKFMEDNALALSSRYEIGKKRHDGKYNIWERKFVFNQHQADWIIVFVAPNWAEAVSALDGFRRRV